MRACEMWDISGKQIAKDLDSLKIVQATWSLVCKYDDI